MAAVRINDIPASGYLSDVFEAFGREFSGWEELGRSETFVVIRAQRYGRWWVLKCLRDECAHLEQQQLMLRKELEVMMQLQHPLVIQATGLEEVEGHGRCIVMEYVDGVTLDRWLITDPDIESRRRIAALLIEAVAYVHSRGIVHRDIKPTNVIVTAGGGSLKLIDFGLADTVSHTVLKQPAGTLGYMSPEQMEREVPDVRNDIYSLGLVLKQMNLGSDYDKAIQRCLLPIDLRYANVAELQSAVVAATAAHHRRRVEAFASLLAVIIVALLAGAWWSGRQSVTVPDTSAAIDSLNRYWQAQRDTLQDANVALQDSLRQLTQDNEELGERQRLQDERTIAVSNAIADGRKVIDKAFAEGCSTLKDQSSKLDNWTMICLLRKLQDQMVERQWDYLNSVKSRFNDTEFTEIIAVINRYRADVKKTWNQQEQEQWRQFDLEKQAIRDSIKLRNQARQDRIEKERQRMIEE